MNTVNELHQIRPGIISVLVMSACLNAALLGTIPISHFIAFFASPIPAPSQVVFWHLHFCHISVFLLVESKGIAELLRYEIDDQVTAFLNFVPCQSFIFWRFAIDLLLFILSFFFFFKFIISWQVTCFPEKAVAFTVNDHSELWAQQE